MPQRAERLERLMWILDNRTPYAAERSWFRDEMGAHVWVVAVKATFEITESGETRLADEQLPLLREAEYIGEPGSSSLRYEAEIQLPKPNTDVVLNAVAHAPRGVPATMVPTRVRVGPIDKQLAIFGPRVYWNSMNGVVPSSPRPFTEFPIVYEWAWGGTDRLDPNPQRHAYEPHNPVGRGFAVRPATLIDEPAHRIEYLNNHATRKTAAGLGPISSHWMPRLGFAGTYDERWESSRNPLLPEDFNRQFLLSAPQDQQSQSHLRGGELVELVNLTQGGLLQFQLPKIYLAFTTFIGKRAHPHRSRLTSVIIEPDQLRLQLVWLTGLPVASNELDYLDVTRIREKRYLS